MRLVTIPFSHYNERARWALQRFGVEFVERGYLPMFHFAGVLASAGLRGGRRDRTSSPLSTPVLVTDDGERLRHSGLIVRYASDRFSTPQTTLYPAEHLHPIEEIERRAHDRIGPHTRRIAYFHLLGEPALMHELVRANVGAVQTLAFRVSRPLLAASLRRALGVTAQRTARSVQVLREEVAALDERLGDRPFLCGDRFTAADLTVAALLSPVLRPPSYGTPMPPLERYPGPLRELVVQMRATPTGAHCMRMYEQERRVVVTAARD
ncbi:MAG: glutathione S-transferase family protein [Nannocystaceae bacterium]